MQRTQLAVPLQMNETGSNPDVCGGTTRLEESTKCLAGKRHFIQVDVRRRRVYSMERV